MTRSRGGKVVGVSMFTGYSYNERSMLSLGIWIRTSRSAPGHACLGRRRRRIAEIDSRAPQADRDSGDGQPGAVLQSCTRGVRGRLAQSAGLAAEDPP